MPNPYADKMAANKENLIERQRRRAIARQTIAVDTTQWVPLSRVRTDPKAQVRAKGIEEDRVVEYALAMIGYGGWGKFPALEVVEINGDLVVADGWHRTEGAHEANRLNREKGGGDLITEVPVIVRPGGLTEALIYGAENNLKNGQPLSKQDKMKYLARRHDPTLPEHLSWRHLSANAIAPMLGVTDKTVKAWRRELGLTSENSEVVGADGRVYRTAKIKKARQRAAQDPTERKRRDVIKRLLALADDVEKLGEAGDTARSLRTRARVLEARWGLQSDSS